MRDVFSLLCLLEKREADAYVHCLKMLGLFMMKGCVVRLREKKE